MAFDEAFNNDASPVAPVVCAANGGRSSQSGFEVHHPGLVGSEAVEKGESSLFCSLEALELTWKPST